MTETTIITIITSILTALPPTIVAFAALRAGQKNNAKSDTLIEKTAEIHELTNSNLTNVKNSLASANTEIVELKKLVAALIAKENA